MDHEAKTTPDGALSQFERALLTLRRWIQDGDVVPNQHLIELELVKSLGVSRTTVRSVLLDLSKEGFVTFEPNRGARVRSFTVEEARDVLGVRERLEGIAADYAAHRRTAVDLDHLDWSVGAMEEAARSFDSVRYAELRSAFHGSIVRAARSATIARMIEQTRFGMVVRQFWDPGAPHPRAESLDEHRAILLAIRAKDGVAAERMMRLHVRSARAALKPEVIEDFDLHRPVLAKQGLAKADQAQG